MTRLEDLHEGDEVTVTFKGTMVVRSSDPHGLRIFKDLNSPFRLLGTSLKYASDITVTRTKYAPGTAWMTDIGNVVYRTGTENRWVGEHGPIPDFNPEGWNMKQMIKGGGI